MALQLVSQAQDQAGPAAGALPVGVLDGLAASPPGPARLNRAWAGVFLAPLGLGDAGKHAEPLEDVRTSS